MPAWTAVVRGADGLEVVKALALAARARRAAAVFMVDFLNSNGYTKQKSKGAAFFLHEALP
jgi:hypothetical protein